jgi:hypothetical protein
LLGSIALSTNRTLGITIRIETRKCDRNTELKGDRFTNNFEVLGIEYRARELTVKLNGGRQALKHHRDFHSVPCSAVLRCWQLLENSIDAIVNTSTSTNNVDKPR